MWCIIQGSQVTLTNAGINIKSLSCKTEEKKKKVIYHHQEKVVYHHASSQSPDPSVNKLYNLRGDFIILSISLSHRNNEKKRKQQDTRRPYALTWSVVSVKNGKSEVGSVAVGSEGGLGQGRQVVHVVETRAVCVIIARQQQVHVVWSLETQEEEEAAED